MNPGPAHPSPDSHHSLAVRITHWVSTLCFVALVVSGVAILVAHPRLYWGDSGNNEMPAWIVFPIKPRLGGPSGWGRSLHFLGAWLMVATGVGYLISGAIAGHFRKHLVPKSGELGAHSLRSAIADHLHGRIRKETAGPHYGVLQKLSYMGVIFVGLPLMILTGLTMSPAVTAAYPSLFALFGGRQSARTIHFLIAFALILFVVVHVVMVVVSGFRRQLRGITIGEKTHE